MVRATCSFCLRTCRLRPYFFFVPFLNVFSVSQSVGTIAVAMLSSAGIAASTSAFLEEVEDLSSFGSVLLSSFIFLFSFFNFSTSLFSFSISKFFSASTAAFSFVNFCICSSLRRNFSADSSFFLISAFFLFFQLGSAFFNDLINLFGLLIFEVFFSIS